MKKIVYILGFSVFFFSGKIFAYGFGPRHVFENFNHSMVVGINMMHFNYREAAREVRSKLPKDNVEDYGNVFGAVISYRNIYFERMATEFSGEYLTGSMQYDGFKYDDGEFERLEKKDTGTFMNLDVKTGPIIFDSDRFQVIPYVGLGFHYWRPESNRNYRHFKALLGAKVNIALFNDLVLSPFFNFGKTLLPKSNVTLPEDGSDVSYSLGSKPIIEMGLEFDYRWDAEISLTGVLSHTHFEYGRVDDAPGSKINELKFGLGIRFGFL